MASNAATPSASNGFEEFLSTKGQLAGLMMRLLIEISVGSKWLQQLSRGLTPPDKDKTATSLIFPAQVAGVDDRGQDPELPRGIPPRNKIDNIPICV